MNGAGLDDLRVVLRNAADGRGNEPAGRFRLAVDRSFTLSGIGTVVTGTVASGAVSVGDHVVASPSGIPARVSSIHAQNRPATRGIAGERCALNLAGDGISKDAVARGDVILDPALHAPADRIDATVRLLAMEQKPIVQWMPARLHHGATEVGVAMVVILDITPLSPGSEGRIQLVLERPIAAAAGDRFILRDTTSERTIGGGRFLDLRAPQRYRKTPERQKQLDAHAIQDHAAALSALLACPPHFVELDAFARDRALVIAESLPLHWRRKPAQS